MTTIAVQDFKRSRELWSRLEQEKELVVTRDGQPCAVLVSVSPQGLEETLAGIRRALFSNLVSSIRERGDRRPPQSGEIEKQIGASRKRRGLS